MKKLLACLVLACCSVAWGGVGSQLFDGNGDWYSAVTVPASVDQSQMCWAYATAANSGWVTTQTDASAVSEYDLAILYLTGATPEWQARSSDSDTAKTASGGLPGTLNTWNAVLGTSSGASNRQIYTNSAPGNANNTANTTADIDSFTVGGIERLSTDVPFFGRLAYCAVWDTELTPKEITEASSGLWPSWVSTENMTAFYELTTNTVTMYNTKNPGTHDLTKKGDPQNSALSPPVYFPSNMGQ